MESEPVYYLGVNGETIGPWSLEEIRRRRVRGEFPPDAFLWDGATWFPLAEFAPPLEFQAATRPLADSAPAGSPGGFEMAESIPATPEVPAAVASGGLPAACPRHPRREAIFLCAGCHQDFCHECVAKRRNRYYCEACLAAQPSPLAVKILPWAAVGPAFIAAAVFGLLAKLYLVITVGSGIAVGLTFCFCLPCRWPWRILLATIPVGTGLAAWWCRLGV